LKTRIHNLSKDGEDKLLNKHEAAVNSMKAKMPIINALGNKNIKDKHWLEIFKSLDYLNWTPGTHFSLGDLMNYNV